ncbi:MAG: PAS domain-containing protein [bacterium]|nr:PAS domain-containing protein [bacterium]
MKHEKVEFLFDLLDKVPHGACVVDADYQLVYWNHTLEEWSFQDRDELLGLRLLDLYPHLRENRYKRRMDQVLMGGPPVFFSPQLHPHFIPLTLASGRKRILQTVVSSVPVGESGDNLLLITITDMTQPVGQLKEITKLREQALSEIDRRKKSEQKLLLHVQQTPFGVIEWDLDFKVTHWNPASENIFGYSGDEAIGKHAGQLIIPESGGEEAKQMWQEIVGQKNGSQNTCENITKEGAFKICEWYYTPLIDKEDNVIGVASLVHDITDRRRMESELRENKKLEAVGLLAGGISHDFNNLLSVIMGNLALLKKNFPRNEEKCLKWLDKIEKASYQASDLVKKLITFSEGGEQERNEVSLKVILESVLNLKPVEKGVTFELLIPEELKSINGDQMQLVQVFYNIFVNAGDAMPDGGIITLLAENITLGPKAEAGLKEGQYIRVTVVDTGTGIPGKFMEKIFDPYFTTKSTTTRKGIGLGLSTCYTIMQNHDGHIAVDSDLGKGTSVYLYLPEFTKDDAPPVGV